MNTELFKIIITTYLVGMITVASINQVKHMSKNESKYYRNGDK